MSEIAFVIPLALYGLYLCAVALIGLPGRREIHIRRRYGMPATREGWLRQEAQIRKELRQ